MRPLAYSRRQAAEALGVAPVATPPPHGPRERLLHGVAAEFRVASNRSRPPAEISQPLAV